MPTPRSGFDPVVINDEIYVIGCGDGAYITENEKYTPSDYIPEFPSWTPVLVGVVALVSMMVFYMKKLNKKNLR
jgi:hypothetical protein